MKEKIVALLDDNMGIKSLCVALKEISNATHKKADQIQKEAEEAMERLKSNHNEAVLPLLHQLEVLLKDKLPEDYSRETYSLGFDLEKNCVTISERCPITNMLMGSHTFEDFISKVVDGFGILNKEGPTQ